MILTGGAILRWREGVRFYSEYNFEETYFETGTEGGKGGVSGGDKLDDVGNGLRKSGLQIVD